MRKQIRTTDNTVLVCCDDLEIYGRNPTITKRCGSCDFYIDMVARNEKNLHCYGPKKLREVLIGSINSDEWIKQND